MKSPKISKAYHSGMNLLFLYCKKNIIGARAVLSIIPLLWIIALSTGYIYNQLDWRGIITQDLVDADFFWQGFIFQLMQFVPLVSIILASSIISYDFAKSTAPLIYTSISREKYLITNIIFLILHQIFFLALAFIAMNIVNFILVQKFISFDLILIGFVFILMLMIFYTSFAFILSALTRNSIIALLIPLFYWFFIIVFLNTGLELLAIDFYAKDFWEFIALYLSSGKIYMDRFILPLDLIAFILVPTALFLLSIRGFQLIDIRTD
jgi:ABC-type transport system involved in multi-copper enzyme maturation permease subunit